MDTIVITTCSNRKRLKPTANLRASALPIGVLNVVAREWLSRIDLATETISAGELYCGRGFREAEITAARFGNKPWIISAGLGLLDYDRQVPAYDLTLSTSSSDCILKRIEGTVTPSDWWEEIARQRSTDHPLLDLIVNNPKALVLIATSSAYTNLIASDLLSLPETDSSRLRIFGPRNLEKVPKQISPLIMPYDARFDGPNSPLPGTRGDFAQRALRHFSETIAGKSGTLNEPNLHADQVQNCLAPWDVPKQIMRAKKTDAEIVELVANLWSPAQGSASKMLRVLRDQEMIACEQGRFAALYKVARERCLL